MENDEAFKRFIMERISDIIGTNTNITKEQINKIVLIYERGFLDALKILDIKNIIEIYHYT